MAALVRAAAAGEALLQAARGHGNVRGHCCLAATHRPPAACLRPCRAAADSEMLRGVPVKRLPPVWAVLRVSADAVGRPVMRHDTTRLYVAPPWY